MNVFGIISELLQTIPAWLRKGLLVLFALVVVAEQVCKIFDVSLPYDDIDATLVLVGGYLGVQSAANVGEPETREAVGLDNAPEGADPQLF